MSLTPREQEILTLVAEGNSTLDIASLLCIEPHTVKTHVSNLCGKLGVGNRIAAAALVWKQRAAEAQAERDRLRQQICELQAETKALDYFMRKHLAAITELGK